MATAPQHVTLAAMNHDVGAWVDEVAKLTQPEKIHWCDGSEAEFETLKRELIADKQLLPLNPQSFPDCVLSRSNPSDVARVEHLTFVCTVNKEDAGPNNHWIAPKQAHAQMDALFAGCMKGRTMYVVPYCMGPLDSAYARCGVEITDIRRQAEDWQREATRHLATGRTAEALEAYAEHGMVHAAETRAAAREDLVDRWDRDRLAEPEMLIGGRRLIDIYLIGSGWQMAGDQRECAPDADRRAAQARLLRAGALHI